jgi:hypothetical protein
MAFALVVCVATVFGMPVPDWRVSNLTAFATFEQYLTPPPDPDHDKNPHPLQPGGLTDLLLSPHMDDACYSSGAVALAKSNRSKMMVATIFGEGDRPLDPTDDSRWSNYMSRNIEDDVVM